MEEVVNSITEMEEKGKKRSEKQKRKAGIQSLTPDLLCIIFSFLDYFSLVRSSTVSKSWHVIINGSKLLHSLYSKQLPYETSDSLSVLLEGVARQNHTSALVEGNLTIDQWKGHTTGIDQCRMKMGLILTGVGDKVMRLWSTNTYKCLEEYSLADLAPLVDFDFDESKVVGLAGTRLCIWRRDAKCTVFPSRAGSFGKGLCMRYMDPEALVGCDDGTVRVFDMHCNSYTLMIRMHTCHVNCLALGDNHLVVSGSSQGGISLSSLSSNERVTTLNSRGFGGVNTLCYNPSTHKVFAGSISGVAACWDLRKMQSLWRKRMSFSAVYSMQHLVNDKSTLVVGGADGILRILDQDTGKILSRCVMDPNEPKFISMNSLYGSVERKKVVRLSENINFAPIPCTVGSPIKCVAVGMGKVVTTHNTDYIRMWKFHKSE